MPRLDGIAVRDHCGGKVVATIHFEKSDISGGINTNDHRFIHLAIRQSAAHAVTKRAGDVIVGDDITTIGQNDPTSAPLAIGTKTPTVERVANSIAAMRCSWARSTSTGGLGNFGSSAHNGFVRVANKKERMRKRLSRRSLLLSKVGSLIVDFYSQRTPLVNSSEGTEAAAI